jgi:hypothetical protein
MKQAKMMFGTEKGMLEIKEAFVRDTCRVLVLYYLAQRWVIKVKRHVRENFVRTLLGKI